MPKLKPAPETAFAKATKKKHPYLGGWMLLPTRSGTCPECGIEHDPTQPHNQQSLAYQYNFYGKHGRWPSWKDAMAHCASEVRRFWRAALRERGVKL